MVSYFLKLKNFDKNFKIFTPIFAIFLLIFSILATIAIINSPPDYQQSNAVKMMYIHVPSAWMALMIYCFLAFFNLFGIEEIVMFNFSFSFVLGKEVFVDVRKLD